MKKVLLIDSGTGGLNILKECVKVCPCCDFLLYCDNKNLPYGNKTKEELVDITIKNLEKIRKIFAFEIVILACNTLTSTCIDECRRIFSDIKFIGTEPAVKPATKMFDKKDILVLATKATIENNKLLSGEDFQTFPMPNLASLIDENLDDLSVLEPILKSELKNISAKAIVLGCTHYSSVKDILLKIFPNVSIFDSANGVARRLKQLIGEYEEGFKMQILTSGEGEMLAKLVWKYFND